MYIWYVSILESTRVSHRLASLLAFAGTSLWVLSVLSRLSERGAPQGAIPLQGAKSNEKKNTKKKKKKKTTRRTKLLPTSKPLDYSLKHRCLSFQVTLEPEASGANTEASTAQSTATVRPQILEAKASGLTPVQGPQGIPRHSLVHLISFSDFKWFQGHKAFCSHFVPILIPILSLCCSAGRLLSQHQQSARTGSVFWLCKHAQIRLLQTPLQNLFLLFGLSQVESTWDLKKETCSYWTKAKPRCREPSSSHHSQRDSWPLQLQPLQWKCFSSRWHRGTFKHWRRLQHCFGKTARAVISR